MIFKHCANCQKLTAHKRVFGAGTVIGFFATFGLWLFVMVFYPIYCTRCGMGKSRVTQKTPKWIVVLLFAGLGFLSVKVFLLWEEFFKTGWIFCP